MWGAYYILEEPSLLPVAYLPFVKIYFWILIGQWVSGMIVSYVCLTDDSDCFTLHFLIGILIFRRA